MRTGRSRRVSRNAGSGAVGSSPGTRGTSVAGGSASTAASSSGVGAMSPAAPPIPPPPWEPVPLDRAVPALVDVDGAAGVPSLPGSGHSCAVHSAESDVPARRAPRAGASSSSRNSEQRSISSASVPTSTTCPASSTAIRSARARLERRCATSRVVRPAVSARSVSWMAASVEVSTADVASSSTSTRGSVSTALASAIRWRCPPDSVSPRSPTSVS